jgi:ADP-ribose diphosphatase
MDKPILPHQIRKIYEGRVFTIQVESVTLPGGHTLDVEVVRHPGSVVLLPMNEQGEIILVRQYRHAIGKWLWELPAGSLNRGEIPAAAAARECHEEIGLIPSKVEHMAALFPTPGYCDEEMVFFRLTGLRTPGKDDSEASPDADEEIEPQAFGIHEVKRLIASGEIIDLKTVAGVALLDLISTIE